MFGILVHCAVCDTDFYVSECTARRQAAQYENKNRCNKHEEETV
ncbi:hypothetical protein JOF45_000376 [Nesterenkonia lacusekhoensis]|uniref:Uncharacterized protein n=1 Tax=Nesterenkonia lacusekhoensis TaxID=150832 RepID=A0ABS4SYT1_9MICC|nr:hypothetical protein [Nesterenkonia lacusekhoensis]